MNIRDYWISKLPEVRKQSSATGRLIESLLVNDSKVARETLVEIAIQDRNIKLQEITAEKHNEYIQETKKRIEKIAIDINNLYSKVKRGEADENDIENINMLETDYKTAEDYIKRHTGIPTNEFAPSRIKQLFEKILKMFEKLFKNSKVMFKDYWTRLFEHNKFYILFMITFCTFATILYGISVYQESKSIGKAIIRFVTKLLYELFVSMAILVFFEEFFKLLNYLSNNYSNY